MFYARYNIYGSQTDMGLADAWQVAGFDTRQARDAWVAQYADRVDITPITKVQALNLAGKLQRMTYRRGGYLAHAYFRTNDNVTFRRAY
jgi:hypothetical protein